MTRTQTLRPARSTNPKWLDAARAFYADSFGATRTRELGAAKDDWSDLTEDEQAFALAHLLYLHLMAEAGTQRLLVQIRDLLDEIADVAALAREVPEDATGEEEDEYDEEPGEDGDEPADFEPPAAGEPETASEAPADEAPVDADGDDASEPDESDGEVQDDDGSEDDEPEDDGGRAA